MNMKIVIVLTFFLLTCTNSAFGQVVVIANKSVPVDTLEKSDLLDIYTGDVKKWSDKQPVVVLDLKPKVEVKKSFYKFLRKSPSRMKSIWLRKMLSGEGDPPAFMNSEEDLLKKVASTPGAIGYVAQAKVSREVKILVSINEVKKQE
jgi:ABC-type phosphate transport system substrate-binding protein